MAKKIGQKYIELIAAIAMGLIYGILKSIFVNDWHVVMAAILFGILAKITISKFYKNGKT